MEMGADLCLACQRALSVPWADFWFAYTASLQHSHCSLKRLCSDQETRQIRSFAFPHTIPSWLPRDHPTPSTLITQPRSLAAAGLD